MLSVPLVEKGRLKAVFWSAVALSAGGGERQKK